ncbi:MAG: hypothetical protein J7K26_03290 [Candidatus Aenigmarchaeota archaeon]|nr:hypothetical protein [Candidatus Aenigmarchaeota archaeon]
MKASTELGEFIAFLFLIVIGFVVGGGLNWLTGIAEDFSNYISGTDEAGNWYITYQTDYMPIRQQRALLSLIEVTYQGYPIKELLEYSVAQGTIDVKINGESINIKDAIREVVSKWDSEVADNSGYIIYLKYDDENLSPIKIIDTVSLAERHESVNVQKTSFDIITPYRNAILEFYVIS